MMSTRAVGLRSAVRQASLASKSVKSQAFRATLVQRSIQTQTLTPSAEQDILNHQRLRRPSSPHFTIYQPQLTWIGSIVNRVTGVGLSVLLYGYALAYLASPEIFASANVIELIHGLPEAVKYAGKVILAAPFSYHTFNGLRHLAWDSGRFLTLKGAYSSGYAMLGATAIATVGLVLW